MCKVDGCKTEKIKALGMCSIHYRRFSKYGDVNYLGREKHGMSKSREYGTWRHMKERCSNPNDISYYLYGGRGITVCERWSSSFLNFLEDMGEKPTRHHQIDRIDNDGNYEPSNCKWSLPCENSQNRRSNKLTKEDVLNIRDSEDGSKDLSMKYKISQSHVIDIKKRHRSWENI